MILASGKARKEEHSLSYVTLFATRHEVKSSLCRPKDTFGIDAYLLLTFW
jgi:hypothetical protein